MKTIGISAPHITTVADAYRKKDPAIRSFFSYDPDRANSYFERVKHIDSRESEYRRKELVDALRSYHRRGLYHAEIEKNLERLEQPGSVVVIGGQQAGLLTGPLYTIYKVITIIQLARREELRLQRPVIPVFWIAGEDHDREEVDHVWIRKAEGKLHRHTYPWRDEIKKRPVSHITMDHKQMEAWLDELAWLLPDTNYKEEWLSIMKKAVKHSRTWSHFFASILHHLFAKYGVLFIDSQDEQIRMIEKPFFDKLLEKDAELSSCVEQSINKLTQLGYPTLLKIEPDQANFFMLKNGERESLWRDGDGFRTKEGDSYYSLEELKNQPQSLSNNVITRTMMQEMLFPTLAFVAGPGEITYWSTLREAFAKLDFQLPIVYPRLQITLMEPKVWKYWQEYQLEWKDLFVSLRECKESWLHNQRPEVDPKILELKEKLEKWYHPIVEHLSKEVSPHLRVIGEKNLQKHYQQVDYFVKQTERIIRQKHQTKLSHWDEIILSLQPNQKEQERVYNLITFWNLYGIKWLDELISQNLLEENNERMVVFL